MLTGKISIWKTGQDFKTQVTWRKFIFLLPFEIHVVFTVSSPLRVIISWKDGMLLSHLTKLSLKVSKHWIYYTGILLDLYRVSFGGSANPFRGIWVITWFTLSNGTLTSHIWLLKFMGNIWLKKPPRRGCETLPFFSPRSFNLFASWRWTGGHLIAARVSPVELPLTGHFLEHSPVIVVIILWLPPYLLF